MSKKLIHEDLTYIIRGCVFDVHNEVGPGLREECYQKAPEYRLTQAGVPFVAKPATRTELIYRGMEVDCFEPDFLVAKLV